MDQHIFEKAAGLSADLAGRWYEPVTAAMREFGIDVPSRQAAFLAQIAHESGGLTQLVESFNYSPLGLTVFGNRLTEAQRAQLGRQTGEKAVPPERQQQIANLVYGGRYGNRDAASGDGWRYRGRGLKQVTFADNYRACGAALGVDLLAQPELLEQDTYAARSAGWFWKAHNLNELADRGDFAGTTRVINGPAMAGQAQREARWGVAKRALLA